MKKLKKPKFAISTRIIDHIIQAVFIFASVLLAFWLTENRESKKQQKDLQTSLTQIASELEFNHMQIERTFAYYNIIISEIDSLKEAGRNPEKILGFRLKNWHGIKTPMLRSTAYQTFLSSGINTHADLGMVKTLADVYSMQSVIEKLNNSFFELATNDSKTSVLPEVRQLTGIYVEILPDILTMYQANAKPWLENFGYHQSVSNSELKAIIESRKGVY